MMMTRRWVLAMGVATGAVLAGAGLVGRAFAAAAGGLEFDASNFTELSKTITTGAGDRLVKYRFYKAIPYVANPVDVAYQCLNVSVPVEIDGKAVDATNAPILLANSVGGYMPSSVAEAEGVGGGGMTGLPPGAMAGGGAPDGAPAGGTEVASGGNAMLMGGKRVSNAEYALAAGYVVVEPGARGRTLTDASGTYYGVAPAAIVDLKAAVRYVRANKGRIPGNTDWIVSSGTSAGGALSSLLGASGDSPLYAAELAALGAADASDAIFATGAWCPITDLEHADMAYEWNWGSNPLASGAQVDQEISTALADGFEAYQESLGLSGVGGFGALTAGNYGDYLLQAYLQPSAGAYLAALSDADRASYLAANPFITYSDGKASFGWSDFLSHVGARKKSVPAFDALDLSTGENNLFGLGIIEARHFTAFSLRRASGNPDATIEADIPAKLVQMNPMHFLGEKNASRSKHWWLRVGCKDSDTSLSVIANLAAAASGLGDSVDLAMYWDAGHGANEDPDAFIAWIARATGYTA